MMALRTDEKKFGHSEFPWFPGRQGGEKIA